MGRRIEREKRTVTAMIEVYCQKHGHEPGCAGCSALRDYALARLDRCRYGDAKPTCRTCPTHCYRPAMREMIRGVMRFSGPRMLGRHPLLAIRHLLDERRG